MDNVRVGSNIDAWCTKCKLVLAHTIEAVAAGIIKRVQCNTCHGKHLFKANEPGSNTKASVRSASPAKNKSKASDYARLLTGKDLTKAAGYSISHHFVKGEIINHRQFGFGVVIEEKDVTKIEVLFETGPKVLVRGRA